MKVPYNRLVDRILKNPIQANVPPDIDDAENEKEERFVREKTPKWQAEIAMAEVLVVDNVAEYFASLMPPIDKTKGEYVSLPPFDWGKDIPCMAPPFPSFWIESCAPTVENARFVGALVRSAERGTEGYDAWNRGEIARGSPYPSKARWIVDFSFFVEFENRDIVYFTTAETWLDDTGKPINNVYLKDGSKYEIGDALQHMQFPFALAMCFLHCRNTKMVEVQQPRPKRRRERRRPLVVYNVLEIEPVKRILKERGDVANTGLKKALHICRGHFKDYREKGMFGKYHGIYWWDSHLRGSSQQGAVVKDYAMKASAQEAS